MKVYGFIPARAGSKSIPLKNIKSINGKPLLQWSIDTANASQLIDEVVVATDSNFITHAVTGETTFERSKESATDEASSEIVLMEFAASIGLNDLVVFIQATSPLTTPFELDQGIDMVLNQDYDTALSVVRQKRFIWSLEGSPDYDLNARPRRQDWAGFFVETGAFYVSTAKDILEHKCRLSGKIGMVECDPKTYLEIDEPEDWGIIEQLLKQQHEQSYHNSTST